MSTVVSLLGDGTFVGSIEDLVLLGNLRFIARTLGVSRGGLIA